MTIAREPKHRSAFCTTRRYARRNDPSGLVVAHSVVCEDAQDPSEREGPLPDPEQWGVQLVHHIVLNSNGHLHKQGTTLLIALERGEHPINSPRNTVKATVPSPCVHIQSSPEGHRESRSLLYADR